MSALTIKDIAQICNVSVSTVSRVLNDHPDVSEQMRASVRNAIEQHRYIPNNSARNLVRTNSDTVALVVRGVSNPFFTRIIKGLELDVRKRGYAVALHQISSDGDELTAAAALAREKRLKGIFLLGGRFNYTPAETAVLHVPYVCCTFTNSFGSLDGSAYSSVAIDVRLAAYDAVKYLYGCGHRRIAALISSAGDKSISELRFDGYRQALSDLGLPFDGSLVGSLGGFRMDDAYRGMRRLIQGGSDFTAVFAISDAIAIAAIKALADCGKAVPGDCSVISIDGLELSQYTVPTLTTLEQPVDDIAASSAEILVGLIEGTGKNRRILLPTALREGGSVTKI